MIDESALKHRNKDTLLFFFPRSKICQISLFDHCFESSSIIRIQPIGFDQLTFSWSSIHLGPNHESLLFQNVPQVKLRFHYINFMNFDFSSLRINFWLCRIENFKLIIILRLILVENRGLCMWFLFIIRCLFVVGIVWFWIVRLASVKCIRFHLVRIVEANVEMCEILCLPQSLKSENHFCFGRCHHSTNRKILCGLVPTFWVNSPFSP